MGERTEDGKTKERRRELERMLRLNPRLVWARNELKHLGVSDVDACPVSVMSGAYRADAQYDGG